MFTSCVAMMAATIPDMQKMLKKGLNYTRMDEGPDTLECMNLRNWFSSKSLRGGARQ
jgi:hypothetical protein